MNRKSVVVILSAARSGSKLFRDVLGQHPEIATIPYDINYVWKYQNYGKHDELNVSDVRPQNARFINTYIQTHAKGDSSSILLEKTVSNTLRVEFVREVIPNARFLHLYRDGRDVAISARSCWNASSVSVRNQSRSLLIKKILRYPYIATAPYILGKIQERAKSTLGLQKRLPVWGPHFDGIESCIANQDLLSVCAHQWNICVRKTLNSLASLQYDDDYISVAYEDFVRFPEETLGKVTGFLDLDTDESTIAFAKSIVNDDYLGQWRQSLSSEELSDVMRIIEPGLKDLGYV